MAEHEYARHMAPKDATCVNTTTAEEPMRRVVNADTNWGIGELPESSVFHARKEINPFMGHLGRCLSCPKITLHMGIMPVVRRRILFSIPDSDAVMPTELRMAEKLDASLIFLPKTTGDVDTNPDTKFPSPNKPRRQDFAARDTGGSKRMRRLCLKCSHSRQHPLGRYRFRRGSGHGRKIAYGSGWIG